MTELVARFVEASIMRHLYQLVGAPPLEVWPVYDAMRSSPDWWRSK